MPLEFRPCSAEDVDRIVPLMYSAGPDAFRYTFSVDYRLQVLDYLHEAFLQGDGEFGYRGHVAAIYEDDIVGLVGFRHARDNSQYTRAAIRQILSFYGPIKGLRVLVRGLRFEKIVAPPSKNVLCLHNLAVAEQHRGKGYGEAIIQYFLQQAQKQGYRLVSLDVAKSNPRARELYERLGFVTQKTTAGGLKNRYGQAVEHEYMEYRL